MEEHFGKIKSVREMGPIPSVAPMPPIPLK